MAAGSARTGRAAATPDERAREMLPVALVEPFAELVRAAQQWLERWAALAT